MNIDIVGQRFGRLTAVRRTRLARSERWYWECSCDCGHLVETSISSLRSGVRTSCGCGRRKHGATGTAEHGVWLGMIDRCSSNSKAAEDYYRRGITVCERWRSFENFLSDMGNRPSPRHTVERKDNDRGYDPDNCEWALPAQQARNKRSNVWLLVNGDRLTVTDAAEALGIKRSALYGSIRRGRPLPSGVEKAQ